MKQKSMVLLTLCALLLLGCVGCNKTAAIPILDPVVLSSSDTDDENVAYNITEEELVKSFAVYSKNKDVLPLKNGAFSKATEERTYDSMIYSFSDNNHSFISFLSSPKTKKVTSIIIMTTLDTDGSAKARKTCDTFIRFLLEVLEPTEKSDLEQQLHLDSDEDHSVIFEDGEHSSLSYIRSNGGYNFIIAPIR